MLKYSAQRASAFAVVLAFLSSIPNPLQAQISTNEKPAADLQAPLKQWRKPARDRVRRIIFNNDGNEPFVIMTEPSVQQMLDARTTGLIGSQVDSIFYCLGGGFGTYSHFTKIGQMYTLKHPPHDHNQEEALFNAGIDPLKVMVDFGRKNKIEMFASFRMNDVHDKGNDAYSKARFKFNKLKTEHPEWLLGAPNKRMKQGGWSAVNYGVPEIRDLAFRYAEEVCKNYDVDGIELDFFRHPVFFKATTREEAVPQADLDAMTELMTRIRHAADHAGRKRGRPILIAMRVPDSVEYCRAIGLDLAKWLADDLLDILVVTSYFQLNDWEYSVALGRKYDVKVYPSLDESRIHDEPARKLRMTNLAYRGRAADAWASGMDGIYLFNAFDPKDPLWRELGDPETLSKQDCDYFGSIRGTIRANGGNLPMQPYLTIETLNPDNPKTIGPGKEVSTRIKIGRLPRELSDVQATLRLLFDSLPTDGRLVVSFNGHTLTMRSPEKNTLGCAVEPGLLRLGANEVKCLPGANLRKEIKWQDAMIEIRHK